MCILSCLFSSRKNWLQQVGEWEFFSSEKMQESVKIEGNFSYLILKEFYEIKY